MQYVRINPDVNGNSRLVIHFLNISDDYQDAIKKANKYGGRKYHTKTFGGGIVFTCYPCELASILEKIKNG